MTLTLTLDVGGTKIAAGLVNSGGELVRKARLPTPHGDAEAVWAVVRHLVSDLTAGEVVRGVGISSAGPIDLPAGTVSPLNIASWRDRKSVV